MTQQPEMNRLIATWDEDGFRLEFVDSPEVDATDSKPNNIKTESRVSDPNSARARLRARLAQSGMSIHFFGD